MCSLTTLRNNTLSQFGFCFEVLCAECQVNSIEVILNTWKRIEWLCFCLLRFQKNFLITYSCYFVSCSCCFLLIVPVIFLGGGGRNLGELFASCCFSSKIVAFIDIGMISSSFVPYVYIGTVPAVIATLTNYRDIAVMSGCWKPELVYYCLGAHSSGGALYCVRIRQCPTSLRKTEFFPSKIFLTVSAVGAHTQASK